MGKVYYTKEKLEEAAKNCISYLGMVRYFGKRPHGGTATHLKQKCEEFDVECSHFKGKAWCKGKSSPNKKLTEEILCRRPKNSSKEKADILRRALIETGMKEICAICGNEQIWQNKFLRLQIDHIDGDFLNNEKENLRFLCPNCHSQTKTFGSKNIGRLG